MKDILKKSMDELLDASARFQSEYDNILFNIKNVVDAITNIKPNTSEHAKYTYIGSVNMCEKNIMLDNYDLEDSSFSSVVIHVYERLNNDGDLVYRLEFVDAIQEKVLFSVSGLLKDSCIYDLNKLFSNLQGRRYGDDLEWCFEIE